MDKSRCECVLQNCGRMKYDIQNGNCQKKLPCASVLEKDTENRNNLQNKEITETLNRLFVSEMGEDGLHTTKETEDVYKRKVKTLYFSTVSQHESHGVQKSTQAGNKDSHRMINKANLRLPNTSAAINATVTVSPEVTSRVTESKEDLPKSQKHAVLECIQETICEENKLSNTSRKTPNYSACRLSNTTRLRKMSVDTCTSNKTLKADVINGKARTNSAIIFEPRKTRRDSVVTKIVTGNSGKSAPVRKTSIVSKPQRTRKESNSQISKREKHFLPSKTIKLTIELPIFTQNVKGISRFVTDFKSVERALLHNDSEFPSITVLNEVSDLSSLHDQAPPQMKSQSHEKFADQELSTSTANPVAVSRSAIPAAVSSLLTRILDDMSAINHDQSHQMEGCRQLYDFIANNPQETMQVLRDVIEAVCKAIQQNPRDEPLLQSAVATLEKLTELSDTAGVHICQVKGIPLLLSALEGCQESSDLLLSILRVLERISEDENVKDELLEHSCQSHVLTTLSRHDDQVEISSVCLSILSNLIQSLEAAKSLLYIGGVYVIIRVTKTHQSQIQVLENACRAIGTFSSHDELGIDVANAGCLTIVLDIFDWLFTSTDKVSHSDSLAECLFYCIACLSKYEETSKELSKSDRFQHRLVSLMTENIQNETLQEYGTWIICNIAEYGCISQSALSVIMKMLMQILTTFPENRNLMQEVLSALNAIISNYYLLIKDYVGGEIILAIIKVMEIMVDKEEIQELGCAFICHLSLNEEVRDELMDGGASKVLASSMMLFQRNSHVQEYGAIGFMNMTANVINNKIRVINDGGIQVLLAAAQNWIEKDDIVLCSLKCLGNLLEIEEGCFTVLDGEGLRQISKIVERYGENSEIMYFVCEVLLHIASASGVAEKFIKELEIIFQIVHGNFGEDEDINLTFCQFYGKLSTNETYFRKFIKPRGLCFLVEVAERYQNNIDIQLTVCKAIASYHMHSKTKSLSQEDLLFVQQSARTFPNNEDIQTVCLGAVTYMSEHSDMNKRLCIDNKLLPDIISAMTQFHDVIQLQVVGLMALENLLTVATRSDIDDVATFTMTILDSMTAFMDNSDVQFFCCRIITRLQKIDCTNTCKDHLLVPLVDILRRRRSTGEAKSSARQALQKILGDVNEYRCLMESHDLSC